METFLFPFLKNKKQKTKKQNKTSSCQFTLSLPPDHGIYFSQHCSVAINLLFTKLAGRS